ncbi:AtpZ/AtpI family protein [Chloroflexota bacterium]
MGRKWAALLRFVGIGWYIGICILLGALGGRWLGQKLDSEIFFTVLGVILGVLVATLGVYRMLGPIMENRGDKGRD